MRRRLRGAIDGSGSCCDSASRRREGGEDGSPWYRESTNSPFRARLQTSLAPATSSSARVIGRSNGLARSVESESDGVRGIEGRRRVVVAVPRLEAPRLPRLDGAPAEIEREGGRAGRVRTPE